MTNALRLGNLDIIRFENVKRRRLFSGPARPSRSAHAETTASIGMGGTATRGLPCLHSQRGLLNSLQWARPRASAKCDARIRKGGDFGEEKAPHRLITPKLIDAAAQRVDWGDPMMRAKLARG